MAETWPVSTVGSPQAQDFADPPTDYVIRQEVAVGPGKARSRYGGVEFVRFSMTLTLAQYRLFKTFYKTTLGDGVLTFTMYNPIEEATITYRFTKPYEVLAVDSLNMRITLDMIEVSR